MNQQNKFSNEVPPWDEYYPDIEQATPKQRKFYFFWKDELSKGNFIDVEGNITYIFVYLYSVIQQFATHKNLDYLLDCFERINRGYNQYEKITHFLTHYKTDAYLLLNNYDLAWFYLKQAPRIKVEDAYNIRTKCKENFIDCEDLCKIINPKNDLTKFGKENLERVKKHVSLNINSIYQKQEKNLIEYFCHQFDFANLTDKDFVNLQEYYDKEDEFIYLKKYYDLMERKYYLEKDKHTDKFRRSVFGLPILDRTLYINWSPVPSIILTALENKLKLMFRECENKLRVEMSLPKIGEGWISETELFYKLKEQFPKEKIISHARPVWLAPQHLDIYFSERNIGIEYQGIQHQEPIARFGGPQAFELQKLRDKKKKRLCKENNCHLIYVYENYDFEELVNKIKLLL